MYNNISETEFPPTSNCFFHNHHTTHVWKRFCSVDHTANRTLFISFFSLQFQLGIFFFCSIKLPSSKIVLIFFYFKDSIFANRFRKKKTPHWKALPRGNFDVQKLFLSCQIFLFLAAESLMINDNVPNLEGNMFKCKR